MNRRKRKSTPVVFGGRVSDEALLMQRQIEEPEPEEQSFGWLINRRTVDNAIQPTGRRNKGNSGAYAPLNHEHPTALIPTSNPQEPVENELRFDGGGFLRRWNGTSWELIPPLPSNATPQPTGVSQVGTSLDYSRADHSHATAILAQGNSQTPVSNEIRYSTNNQLVRWDGSNWVAFKVDASDILNPPPSTITVRKNSGTDIGTRPRLNFIEGNNITLTISDDSTDDEIDITIEATGGGGGNPYNSTPQPTGIASAGTTTDYSRGDHSHATAILAQTDSQTPVSNEIRFNANNKLVRWNGSQWVELSVESSTTPVQSTSNYSEQGSNDGEIWYRTNDRAVFFRVGGQRVYPAAALFTVGESATNTNAGNRMLLLNSTADNLLRVGGSVNQTVFAYPKLPVISGGMSTNANWDTGAGSNPTGALWVDTSQGSLPFIYYNSFVPEKLIVGRVRYYSGSMSTGAYATSEPDGVLEMGEGGNLFVKSSGLTYVYGYSNTFDFVSDGYQRLVSGWSVVDNVHSGSTAANVVDIFSNNTLTYLYDRYVELGDASDTVFIMFPIGFLRINNSIQAADFRMRVEMPYIRVSGSNAESWQAGLILVDVSGSSVRKAYVKIAPMSSSTITSCGSGLMNWSALTNNMRFEINYWEYYKDGTYMTNTSTVPTGRYHVLFLFRRTRGTENTPRSTTRHRYITVMTTLPINRVWFE